MAALTKEPPEPFKIVFWSMGDVNGDGVIDGKDLTLLREKMSSNDIKFDLNGDGKVDIIDLSVCARNQGKTIQSEWDAVVSKEFYQETREKSISMPNNPWYMDWLQAQAKVNNRNIEAFANYLGSFYADHADSLKQIASFPVLWQTARGLYDKERTSKEILDSAKIDKALETGDFSSLPTEIQTLKFTHDNVAQWMKKTTLPTLDIFKWVNPASTPSVANAAGVAMREEIYARMYDTQLVGSILGGIGGQIGNTLGGWQAFYEKYLGIATITSKLLQYEYEFSLYPKLARYYNLLWTPSIPPYTDLINMRVKEKITQGDFELYMQYQGYAEEWSKKIWDAHFAAPNLDDVLTAWRRGIISEKRVDELMILIDLDPFYKNVFDTRKHVDPSITLARYMFETGAIDKDGVKEIVHRNGFTERDTEIVTDFIERFQERRFRLRYISTLMMGAVYGVYSDADIIEEVVSAGYTRATALMITKIVAARKKIMKEKRPTAESKLLSLGDLKKAFVSGKIGEDRFRIEVLERGYQLEETEIMISLLKDQVTTEQAGGHITLSVTELLDSWRYGVISEDDLHNRLINRGLSLDETDTLITTKKKKWEMEPS